MAIPKTHFRNPVLSHRSNTLFASGNRLSSYKDNRSSSLREDAALTHLFAIFGASAPELNGLVDAEGLEPPTPSV